MPNQRKPSQVAITVYIDRDLKAAVQAHAKRRGETLTAIVIEGFYESLGKPTPRE